MTPGPNKREGRQKSAEKHASLEARYPGTDFFPLNTDVPR